MKQNTIVNFYENVDDSLLKFAVIIAKYNGKYVFCKHRERSTLEVPGGHREAGETIFETAGRELYEETGALDFEIKPICVYSVTAADNFDGQETFGMLYFAEIRSFDPKLHSEIERIVMTNGLPQLSPLSGADDPDDADGGNDPEDPDGGDGADNLDGESELRRGWTYPEIQPKLIEEAKKRGIL